MHERSIALFDIDRTAYNGILGLNLCREQEQRGLLKRDGLRSILHATADYRRGLLDYETFIREFLLRWAKGLQGAAVASVEDHADTFSQNRRNEFFSYLQPTLDHLRKTHAIYFITGEPQFVAGSVARMFAAGFISSSFSIKEGVFTGEVETFLATRDEKVRALGTLVSNYNLDGSIGFGDSEGDIEMLRLVRNRVCISPTSGLLQVALQENWRVVDPMVVYKEGEDLPFLN